MQVKPYSMVRFIKMRYQKFESVENFKIFCIILVRSWIWRIFWSQYHEDSFVVLYIREHVCQISACYEFCPGFGGFLRSTSRLVYDLVVLRFYLKTPFAFVGLMEVRLKEKPIYLYLNSMLVGTCLTTKASSI